MEESMRIVTSILSQEDSGGQQNYSDFERASPSPIGKKNFSFKKPDGTNMVGEGLNSNSKMIVISRHD